MLTGIADPGGALDGSATFNATGDVSMRVIALGPDALSGPLTLLAAGQTAPPAVAVGSGVSFTAEGLNDDDAYQLRSYAAGECTGAARLAATGTGAPSTVGTVARVTPSVVGFQLVAGDRTSNCVTVTWLAAIDGPDEPGTSTSVPPDVSVPPDESRPARSTPTGQLPVTR